MENDDKEVVAMGAVAKALSQLDKEEIARVLSWASAKYGAGMTLPANGGQTKPFAGGFDSQPVATPYNQEAGEIPGIARLEDDGTLTLTVRDLKARSANEAAIRLAHVAIYAYCKLSGEKVASSRGIVTPLLQQWRVYDGNTRRVLKEHRGIIRNGDLLSLDAHSRAEAEQYIAEILDPSIDGKWKASTTSKRKKRVEGE